MSVPVLRGTFALRAVAHAESLLIVRAMLRAAAREAIQGHLSGDVDGGRSDLARPFTALAEEAFFEVYREMEQT